MSDEKEKTYFPYKTVSLHLEEIKERERIINENVTFISLSREYIQKLLTSAENEDRNEKE